MTSTSLLLSQECRQRFMIYDIISIPPLLIMTNDGSRSLHESRFCLWVWLWKTISRVILLVLWRLEWSIALESGVIFWCVVTCIITCTLLGKELESNLLLPWDIVAVRTRAFYTMVVGLFWERGCRWRVMI